MPLSISLLMNGTAIALYLAGTVYLINNTLRHQNRKSGWLLLIAGSALLFHGVGSYHMLIQPAGMSLSLLKACSLIAWIMNVIVLLSGLKKPLHNLFLFLFPISAVSLAVATLHHDAPHIVSVDNGMIIHILLSVLSYSLLIIATLQSLLLAYQDHQLKNKHPVGLIRLLPPLQTMEALLFDILWAGEILLTLAILTGFAFLENMFAQHLVHKTVLSLLAWVIYATLLVGHWRFGWRGYTAIRWTLGGFSALMLAYFGSKFVLEVLLS